MLEHVKVDDTLIEQRSMAMSLMDKMESFEFVFTMHMLRNIMELQTNCHRPYNEKIKTLLML